VHNKQQQPITAADNSKNKKNKKKPTVEKNETLTTTKRGAFLYIRSPAH
jgi:hypothetical protein